MAPLNWHQFKAMYSKPGATHQITHLALKRTSTQGLGRLVRRPVALRMWKHSY